MSEPNNPILTNHEVISSDGISIECNYLHNPNFETTSNLCLSLHLMFISVSTTRMASWIYTLRQALNVFLDFKSYYNSRQHPALQLNQYTDITPPIFIKFHHHLLKSDIREVLSTILKSGLIAASREVNILPKLELPRIKKKPGEVTEPLYDDGFKSLECATISTVNDAYRKLKLRKSYEAAQPYTLEEIINLIKPTLSKMDVLIWFKYQLTNKLYLNDENITARASKCDDSEINSLVGQKNLKHKLLCIYNEVQETIPYDAGIQPFLNQSPNIRTWDADHSRVIKTFLVHQYPLSFDKDSLTKKYDAASLSSLEKCDDIIKILIHKCSHGKAYCKKFGLSFIDMDDILALYYPTEYEMAGIVQLMMLQSGWNKESVMALDPHNYEHPLTELSDGESVIVFSEKNRGQGSSGSSYDAPKIVTAFSNRTDPYSFYNLIRLAIELSKPLQTLSLENTNTGSTPLSFMFSFIRPWAGWSKSVPVGVLNQHGQFGKSVNLFLKKYEIIDDEIRITSASDLTRRLRPTWLIYKKKTSSFIFLSQTMGHKSRDTTDTFYDNSGPARQSRSIRLREALTDVVEDIRKRKFCGLVLSKSQTTIKNSFHIFHIPGHEHSLWACSNPYEPNWPGASTGKLTSKCTDLDQCIFCGHLRLFQDSLPYLLERLSHVEEALENVSYFGHKDKLLNEKSALEWAIDDYDDEEALLAAARYRRKFSPLLPREMSSLKLIFKTGDLDE
jgi:hypothetical protein